MNTVEIAHTRCDRPDHCGTCVCWAPNWRARADALYDVLASAGAWAERVAVLSDGRMVVIGNDRSVFESAR